MNVSKYISDGDRCIQGYFVNKFLAIVNQITQVHIHIDHDLDALIWNNFVEGDLTAKIAFKHF